VVTLVQEQLKKVGINVEAQLVEHATYHENIRKTSILWLTTLFRPGDYAGGAGVHSDG
jgi:hypothetical protein